MRSTSTPERKSRRRVKQRRKQEYRRERKCITRLNVAANNTVMEKDLEWVTVVDGDIMVSGAERTGAGIATVAVTMGVVCTTALTSGHLDAGVSLVKKK